MFRGSTVATDNSRPAGRSGETRPNREKRLSDALRANLRRRKAAHVPDDAADRKPGREGENGEKA